MNNLTIFDLINLISSRAPSPEVRLEKVFEWSHARNLEIAKWLLTTAIALFVPVAIAFLRNEIGEDVSGKWVLLAVFGSVGSALWGLLLLLRARRTYVTYLAAQSLLSEIGKISTFLERYRQESEL